MQMSRYEALEILEHIKARDEEFFEAKREEHGAATFCARCTKNTHVGLYPLDHRFARPLCSDCGRSYAKLLEALKEYGDG